MADARFNASNGPAGNTPPALPVCPPSGPEDPYP